MSTQIQVRRDTAANWTSANPTLASGEIALETDTGFLKVGDGSTAWTSLGYAPLGKPISWSFTPYNMTLGNGTVSAQYTITGKLVVFEFRITLGSTSAVTSNIGIPLPNSWDMAASPSDASLGFATARDTSASLSYPMVYTGSANSQYLFFFAIQTNGAYGVYTNQTSTIPFTWANTDYLEGTIGLIIP